MLVLKRHEQIVLYAPAGNSLLVLEWAATDYDLGLRSLLSGDDYAVDVGSAAEEEPAPRMKKKGTSVHFQEQKKSPSPKKKKKN